METFAKLMSTIGTSSNEQDLVAKLPVELAEIIFRQLDPRSLLNVARVSKKWMNVCKGDCNIRRTARLYSQKERRQLLDLDRTVPKLKQNQMTIPERVNVAKNPFINPVTFSFRPSSGVLPGVLTGPKRNRGSKMIPKRIMTRLR